MPAFAAFNLVGSFEADDVSVWYAAPPNPAGELDRSIMISLVVGA
jgi:hypothetical protein